jgi:predicted nucleic acid-binding protein
MAKGLVAVDASPLIGLAAAGDFDLLRRLFGKLTITRAVYGEVLAGGDLPGATELAEAIAAGWIEVVRNPPRAKQFPDLGAGEASTLALAMTYDGSRLVVMDELIARAHARELGIPVTGLAGVLLAAKQAGYVKKVRSLFERLAAQDFRISEEVVRGILESAGES